MHVNSELLPREESGLHAIDLDVEGARAPASKLSRSACSHSWWASESVCANLICDVRFAYKLRYVKRALATTIRRAKTTFPAILVTGARQTGKTTLLAEEFGSSHRYVSLERPDVRARALADPVGFFEDNPPPLILDEIQYAPELLHHIKERIDTHREPGRWLLTGSQTFSLMEGVSQTMSGRVAVLSLDPLSVSERVGRPKTARMEDVLGRVFAATASKQKTKPSGEPSLVDWIMRGGFPEVQLDSRVDPTLWFASYVQTYLERDVRELAQVADLAAFSRFVMLIAARTGTVVNMSKLGRDVGVTGPTAKRWLSVLETSQLIYLLQPYYRNFGKRIRKSPKLYVLDPGLATHLVGLRTHEAVLHGPSIGALTETAVVGEWIKAFRQRGETPPLYYWESSGEAEVDLVIDHGGMLYGLEIKSTATPVPRHADGLVKWLELAGASARGALACRIDRPTSLRKSVRAVPWHLAW